MTTDELRCPSCRSLVRPGAAWCSLCHADLRPMEEREPVAAVYEEPGPDPLTAVLAAAAPQAAEVVEEPAAVVTAAPPRGRHARSAPAVDTIEVPDAADDATRPASSLAGTASGTDLALASAGIDVAAVERMLGQGQELPFPAVAARLRTKEQKLAVVAGLMGGLMLLVLLVMFVLGSVLH